MENRIFDYPKICEDIKSFDEKIQFVSVINADGNLITGGINGDSVNIQKSGYEGSHSSFILEKSGSAHPYSCALE